jgi:ribonuclease HI
MLITLFTDASHCDRTLLASYAAWMKVNGQTHRRAAMLRGRVPTSNTAELRALVNGIFIALHSIQPPPGSRIIAQTDSQTAIDILTRPNASEPEAKLLAKKLATTEIEIEYRHVNGHRGNVTPRNAVNTWCDVECRRLLREARARELGGKVLD